MKEVTLNNREQIRLMVLNKVETGQYKRYEAADILDLSLRQTRRLLTRYRREGPSALAHGNRGKQPSNALNEMLKQKIIELAQEKYRGFNFQHFTDSLKEREKINISRSSVRNIFMGAGIKSPKTRRPPKHRSRRERFPQEGMLLQVDGSPHDWLEGRGPRLTLIGAIDDATGKVPYAFFQEEEDSRGYFLLLREIVEKDGIPLALYHDRHTIFDSPKDEEESIEDQLEGKKNLTQFGRLLDELEIKSISANSPQAKGRVERLWGTFQDRLISELRLANARTLEDANKVLIEYLPIFNRDFQVAPREPGLAYRKLDQNLNLDRFFCFKYMRYVGGDNVIRFNRRRLQVLPSNGRMSYAHARVEVHEKLDGDIAVFYQGNYLTVREAPKEAPLQRVTSESRDSLVTLKTRQTRYKPAPNHPWRRPFKIAVK